MFVVTSSALFISLSVVQDFWTNKMYIVIRNSCDPKTQKRCTYLKSLKFDMQWSPFGDYSDAVVLKMNNESVGMIMLKSCTWEMCMWRWFPEFWCVTKKWNKIFTDFVEWIGKNWTLWTVSSLVVSHEYSSMTPDLKDEAFSGQWVDPVLW
jgi:hypothetical protein